MTRYVVGVDGGNSKTEIVLADRSGTVCSRVQVAGTRSHRDGLAATVRSLADGVRLAVSEAGLPPSTVLSVAVFCLANVDVADEEAAARIELDRLAVAGLVFVHNDTFAVLRAGSRTGWGVAVVAGAGINAVGVHPDGRVHRFLGLGPETGDWGGGAAIALAGLGAAVRAGDGRGPDTALRSDIAKAMSCPDVETVAFEVNRGSIDEAGVRSLAPVVLDAATAGDAVAAAIVVRMADEVVDFAAASLRRLDLLDAGAEVVLGGGMLQSGHAILLDRIRGRLAEIAPTAMVTVLDVAPVAGAVVEALAAVDAGRAALDRARAALRS